MLSRGLAVAIAFAAVTSQVHAAEIELRHINDQYSSFEIEDDLYTGTVGVSGTVAGWTFDLDEYLFTDKVNGLRFDETYLTVARELLEADSAWSVRARAGAVHLGRGLYGQRLQNFVHEILQQEEVDLPYVGGSKSYGFVRLNVGRELFANKRVAFAALMEVESAGFKGHVRVAVTGRRALGRGFGLHAEYGQRYSDTSYAPLLPWIKGSEPAFAIGVEYKRFLDLTWSRNHFGTGEYHWHVTARVRFGKAARTRSQAGTVVSSTPFSPPQPLAR